MKILYLFSILLVVFAFSSPLQAQQPFMRGDTDSNLIIDVADAIYILNYLFPGQGPGSTVVDQRCEDSSDVDDNGLIDIADGIRLLGYLFTGSAPPPDPFSVDGVCGLDLTDDQLTCEGPVAACPSLLVPPVSPEVDPSASFTTDNFFCFSGNLEFRHPGLSYQIKITSSQHPVPYFAVVNPDTGNWS